MRALAHFTLSAAAVVFASCGRDQRGEAPKVGEPSEPEAPIAEAATGGAPFTAAGTGGLGGGGSSTADSLPQPILFEGVTLPDGTRGSILVHGGRVVLNGPDSPPPATIVDGTSLWAYPGFVDSHVHLTYLPKADELASAGILAAVDLAAPVESLSAGPQSLHLLPAGPMITSLLGYPTQSWGRDGYGLEVATEEEARAAVMDLFLAGARVIKIPLDGESSLSDLQVRAITTAAHDLGLKVAAHALSLVGAERAAFLECDLLAHTPTEELSEGVIAAWGNRAVISTLLAFGASEFARSNLARLHAAGATILYGTDFGNSRVSAIDTNELLLLTELGLSIQEALRSATTNPALYWSIPEGRFTFGGDASFLLLTGDPAEEISVLSPPAYAFYRGQELRRPGP